ncbi:hypothetical protein ACFL6S_33255 [Candidatus Poribacteria bacterium]
MASNRFEQLTPALYEVLREHRKQHLGRGAQGGYTAESESGVI